MPDGLDEIFAEATAAVADGGGDVQLDTLSKNANVWTGDEEVSGETNEVTDDESGVGEIGETGNTPGDGISDDVFDYSAYGDKLVEVVVDGETIKVPLKDAIGGFMRQSDYTRKTQQLAEDRKLAEWGREMQRAFEVDPLGTLQALNDAFGYRQQAPQGEEDIDPELAPIIQQNQVMSAELRRVQAQMAQIEQDRVLSEVRAEMADVKARYGDFDASKVLGLAAERGLSIEDAYLLNRSRELIESDQRTKAEAVRAAELAKVEAAKRDAASRVAARSQANVDDTEGGDLDDFDDFGSLFEHNLKKSRNR